MKNKEWLKNEIEIMGSETSENYPHEQMVDREVVLNLIDQLDEPELPVIPQFAADYIKVSKEDNESLNQAFAFIDDKENKELWNWMFPTIYEGRRENQESFARAWLSDYTIEKEPMYLVKVNDQGIRFTNKQQAECIAKFFNGEVEEVAE